MHHYSKEEEGLLFSKNNKWRLRYSMMSRDDDNDEYITNFFQKYNHWFPMFKSVMDTKSAVPVATSLLDDTEKIDPIELFSYNNSCSARPWKLLDAVPNKENEEARYCLELFLNEMHEALVKIPVVPGGIIGGETKTDTMFIEEGRRLLAIDRFHVLSAGDDFSEEDLFSICWSELAHFYSKDAQNSGSVILLSYSSSNINNACNIDLFSFTKNNLSEPLTWLGIRDNTEVTSISSEKTQGIRLIHRLAERHPPDDRESPKVIHMKF